MTIEDMAGGTFTISNGGIYGSLMGERQTIPRMLIFKELQSSIYHRQPSSAYMLQRNDRL
jgi:pyruvate/2-oxoglutarate dehydrogenase complex dihydrolipoamide acyltransferase (E2) component